MKNTILASLFFAALLPVRADLIWYESFAYENGPIIFTGTNTDGTTNWFRHSGTSDPSDAVINNYRLEVAATVSGGALTRQDDVNRKLATTPDNPLTNTPTVLFASFTVNCTNLPTTSGYFAHFMTGNTFRGKVFGLAGSLPGTWRLGVTGGANSVTQIFPVDLAANTDYQVVLSWDPVTLYAATLWVNPIALTDVSVMSSDAVTLPPAAEAFAFRQASSFGRSFFSITNVAVATTFEEAATAVWATTPVPPVIVSHPQAVTNFVGDGVNLSALAAGQGLVSLTYQWRKDGVDLSNANGNSNVLSIASAAVADTGNYDLVVTTANGLSVTSAMAFLWVTNPPVPPTITLQPVSTNLYFGQAARFQVAATGFAPNYQWFRDGNMLPGQTDTVLLVPNVQADNDTLGTYRCDVSNIFGTTSSSDAVLTASVPPAVSIGYLRTLVDPVFFLPTNTTALWTVTGIVTTHTNVTTVANSSFYMQDDTGGICVFVGGTTEARPEAGDSVTVTGPLGIFNSLLEMNLAAADPAHRVVTNSHRNLLPPGKVLPFSFTNSAAFGYVSNAIERYQGAVVTFTNVFFPEGFSGTNLFVSRNYTITNEAGERFSFRVDLRVMDIIGKPVPSFAWTVSGPMGFFLNATATNRSSGFQLLPTRYSDIVTEAPPAVSVGAAVEQGRPTLTWTAVPYMSYTVYRASNLAGPFEAIAPGLTFNTASGRYTDPGSSPDTRFYKVASP